MYFPLVFFFSPFLRGSFEESTPDSSESLRAPSLNSSPNLAFQRSMRVASMIPHRDLYYGYSFVMSAIWYRSVNSYM